MEVIVSAEPLIGMSRASNGLGKHYLSIFQDDVKAKIFLAQLQGLGIKTFLCPYHPRLLKLFEGFSKTVDFEICPIHLNVVQYSRDIQNYGMVGFALRQLKNMRVRNIPGIALFGMSHLLRILMRDFQYASLLLASMEMASFRRFHPRVMFLHPQITDLILANENKEFFRLFASFARKYKAEAGLMTNNTGILIDKLEKWNVDVTYIAGPINRTGYHMTPGQHRCEEIIANTRKKIIATDVNLVAIPTEDDLAYLKKLNVSSFVVELTNAVDAIMLMDLIQKLSHNTRPQDAVDKVKEGSTVNKG